MLPWTKLWHNTNSNASIGMTPFLALYEREVPLLPGFQVGKSSLDATEQETVQREVIIHKLKENLAKAQATMKKQADNWEEYYLCLKKEIG